MVPSVVPRNFGTRCLVPHKAFIVHDLLDMSDLANVQREADARQPHIVRSALPGLRQGNTAVCDPDSMPATWSLYFSPFLHYLLSKTLSCRVHPVPMGHPLGCCLLYSTRPGDFIGEHRDVNHYRGRTFTALLTLHNRDAQDRCCSSNRNCMRLQDGEVCMDTMENSLLCFEGDDIRHRTVRLGDAERRVVLSMVFTTDSTQSLWQHICMRIKDASFLGI